MIEVRCKFCRRLLFKADAARGRVEVVCPDRRCHKMQTLSLGDAVTKAHAQVGSGSR